MQMHGTSNKLPQGNLKFHHDAFVKSEEVLLGASKPSMLGEEYERSSKEVQMKLWLTNLLPRIAIFLSPSLEDGCP